MKFKSLLRLFALIAALLLISCAQNKTSPLTYKSYSGQPLPDSEVTTLTFGKRVKEFLVDDIKIQHTDYGSIKLLPGVHNIEWKHRFAISALVNPAGWDEIEAATSVTLQAGHVYSINAGRTVGHGYRMILWILDETAGKRVFEKKI